MFKIIFWPVKFIFGILVNSTKFLWKKKIWKIKAIFVSFFTGVLLFIGFYQFVNILAAHAVFFIYAGTVLIGTATAEKSSYKNEIKEALNEYKKYNVKCPEDIPVEKFREQGEKENFGCYIGYNAVQKKPIYINDDQRYQHIQVLGTTGAGKTSGVICPIFEHDAQKGYPIIVIDAKGDFTTILTFTDIAKKCGREKDLQIFSISHVKNSYTYNPLENGNSTQLKDKIIGSMDWTQKDARFYKDKCAEVLEILFYEHEKYGKEPLTFSEVHRLLKNPDIIHYPILAKVVKTSSKDISSLITWLSLFIYSTFGSLLESPRGKINILEGWKNNKIMYFALDTQSYETAGKELGKIITREITTLSGKIQGEMHLKNRPPIGIFIDEFQFFGTESFINVLSRGRASKMMFVISHPSISDLNSIGGETYKKQLKQNISTTIVMKTNEVESAKSFSDLLGVYKTIEKTYQTIIDKIISRFHTIIEKVVDKKIIPSQVFLELKNFEAIYIYSKESCKIFLAPIFVNVENKQLPEIKHRKNTDKKPPPSEPTPPESVF